jgi:hypothetical protein
MSELACRTKAISIFSYFDCQEADTKTPPV